MEHQMAHKTIKVDADIHKLFKAYCGKHGIALGKFTEGLFLCALSGSISGSTVGRLAFREHAELYGEG